MRKLNVLACIFHEHVYAAIYSAALTLTYIICINHKQWAISLSNKSTDYLRKDINIFSLSIFLKFCWLYFDDHSSCLIAIVCSKNSQYFPKQKKKLQERQQLLHVNGLWYSNFDWYREPFLQLEFMLLDPCKSKVTSDWQRGTGKYIFKLNFMFIFSAILNSCPVGLVHWN